MIGGVLRGAARHGRAVLVAGLVAGFTLQGVAAVLRDRLPELVALLLFLTALRIGPRHALGGLAALGRSLRIVAVYQLAAPLAALGLFAAAGWLGQPLALAVILVLSAPPVTGAPNFTILLGHDPAPAMRLLIAGTAVLPLSVLPVLWLMPGLGAPAEVIAAALRLLAVIAGATAAGFALRVTLLRGLDSAGQRSIDGLAAITLAVVVVGLMAALGPALRSAPLTVAGWTAAAFAVNFGAQLLARQLWGPQRSDAVPVAIAAGNRNIALFLVALPAATTDPLLIFIGCYQLPMYLTPILLRGVYGRPRS